MKKALLAACLVCCLASAAFAQQRQRTPAVGDEAPEFAGGANWVMNAPAETPKLADLRGEVIVIEHWGTR